MTDSRESINEALDLAAAGAIDEACERLWPLVRQTDGREEALFTMACCYERAGQLPPAVYLFGWIAERYADFSPARERLDRCRRLMADRGLHEDFADSGHVACPSCTLRYRAELPVCPYCGGQMGAAAQERTPAAPPALPGEPPSRDVLDEIGRDLERAWKSVQTKFHEFTERQDLSGAALRVQELAREAKARARTLADSEKTREVTKSLGEFSGEAARRMREFAQHEKVQSIARQTKHLGEEALSRVKAVTAREEVKDAREKIEVLGHETADRVESWAKSDEVRTTWRKVFDTVEGIMANLQRRIDRVTGRKSNESED
jgi:hypothetical protein